MLLTYGYVTILFLERNSNTKEINKKKKNANFQQNLAVFLAGTDSEIKLFKYYTERTKNVWTTLSSLGQEPTFKTSWKYIVMA